jgi:glycosyltransferase involved in cell wall biosynthesis
MRILWLSHLVPYPPKGGVQQRSYNLIRELSKYHELVVVAFNQRAHIGEGVALNDAIHHFGSFCVIHSVHDIPSDLAPFGASRLAISSLISRDGYTIRWLRSEKYRRAVEEAVRKFQPDAAHFDTISLAPYRKLVQKPAALNHHNIESDMLLRRSELDPNLLKKVYFAQEGRRLRRYEKQAAREFDVHLTCSALDAQRLQAVTYPDLQTEVIPNGVDLSYFCPSETVTKIPESLVFAGRLSWYPNAAAVKYLAGEIWPLLRLRRPSASVKVIGKSPPAELVAAAAADSSITVTGFVDDVRPYLEEALVYVCPIFDGGGTKLKILDALAMGCAIVAHPIACEGIEVTDGKDVLLASTPNEFVSAIERLFDDASLRSRLRENALALARSTYSFIEIGKKLSQCYERIADSTTAP